MTILSPELCWCFSLTLLGAAWHIYILGTLSTSLSNDPSLSRYILNSSNTLLPLKSFLLKLYLDYPPRGSEKTSFSYIFLIFMIFICWFFCADVCMHDAHAVTKRQHFRCWFSPSPCFKEGTLLFLSLRCKRRIFLIAVSLSQIITLPLLLRYSSGRQVCALSADSHWAISLADPVLITELSNNDCFIK